MKIFTKKNNRKHHKGGIGIETLAVIPIAFGAITAWGAGKEAEKLRKRREGNITRKNSPALKSVSSKRSSRRSSRRSSKGSSRRSSKGSSNRSSK